MEPHFAVPGVLVTSQIMFFFLKIRDLIMCVYAALHQFEEINCVTHRSQMFHRCSTDISQFRFQEREHGHGFFFPLYTVYSTE